MVMHSTGVLDFLVCTKSFQFASIDTGTVEMPITACVAETYACWQPPDEPLNSPSCSGGTSCHENPVPPGTAACSRHTQISQKGDHERHDWCRVLSLVQLVFYRHLDA